MKKILAVAVAVVAAVAVDQSCILVVAVAEADW